MKSTDSYYVYYPFSLIFQVMGLYFDYNKKFPSIIRAILWTKSFCLSVYLVVQSFQLLFGFKRKISEKIIKFNLFYLSTHIKSIIIIASFLIFTFKFRSISRLLFNIEKNINEKNRKSMKIFNTILAVVWILAILANTALYALLTERAVKDMDSYTQVYVTLWTLQNIAWFFATHCLFVLSCHGIHLIETNVFEWVEDIESQMNTSILRFLPKYKDLYERIALILNLKKSVNTTLGFLPMLYLCISFSSSCLRLTHLSIHKDNINVIILIRYFFEYSLIQAFNLFVIISVSHYQSKRPNLGPINELLSCLF